MVEDWEKQVQLLIYSLIVASYKYIKKDKIQEDEIFEIAINAGAKDCINMENFLR